VIRAEDKRSPQLTAAGDRHQPEAEAAAGGDVAAQLAALDRRLLVLELFMRVLIANTTLLISRSDGVDPLARTRRIGDLLAEALNFGESRRQQ
jgi:hypothetical protein